MRLFDRAMMMKKYFAFMLLLLSACSTTDDLRKREPLYTKVFIGNHVEISGCSAGSMLSDFGAFMKYIPQATKDSSSISFFSQHYAVWDITFKQISKDKTQVTITAIDAIKNVEQLSSLIEKCAAS